MLQTCAGHMNFGDQRGTLKHADEGRVIQLPALLFC